MHWMTTETESDLELLMKYSYKMSKRNCEPLSLQIKQK